LPGFVFLVNDPDILSVPIIERTVDPILFVGSISTVGIKGRLTPGFGVIKDVVMGGDIFLLSENAEVVFPDQMVDLQEGGAGQSIEDVGQVGIPRDHIEGPPGAENPLGLTDPFEAEPRIILDWDLDVPIDDEFFFAVVVPVKGVSSDSIGGIGDDQIDRIVRDVPLGSLDAILVEKEILERGIAPHQLLPNVPGMAVEWTIRVWEFNLWGKQPVSELARSAKSR